VTTLTVTATQGGAGAANGMLVRVLVLTSAAAAASQTGATATSTAGNNASIVTTATGSRVYGAMANGGTSYTAEPLCTLIDNFLDTGGSGERWGAFRTTSATGTPGSTLVGSSASGSFPDIAAAEILPAGTIAEDASAPAVATTGTAIFLTTASFTPPAGSLVVVMVACDGTGSALVTMAVTDTGGGLTWIPQAQAASASTTYAGVWIAQVPSGGASAQSALVQPGRLRRSRRHGRRQQLQASPGQPGFEGWGQPL
jgi:hypothetical protein